MHGSNAINIVNSDERQNASGSYIESGQNEMMEIKILGSDHEMSQFVNASREDSFNIKCKYFYALNISAPNECQFNYAYFGQT